MIKSYFPPQLSLQAAWYDNFAVEFPKVAETLGFGAKEIPPIVNDCLYAVWMIQKVAPAFDGFRKSITGYVQNVLNGQIGAPLPALPTIPAWPEPPVAIKDLQVGIHVRRALWVERIKRSPAYTPGIIGVALLTESTGSAFDPDTYRAELRSANCIGPDQVQIKFGKAAGEIDVVKVSFRRGGSPEWIDSNMFVNSPGIDPTPVLVPGKPEEREYRIRAMVGNVAIGFESDIVTCVVRG